MSIEKLTLQEKIQAYEEVLKTFEDRVKFFATADCELLRPGICAELVTWLVKNKRDIVTTSYGFYGIARLLEDIFPELYKLKPTNVTTLFWFKLNKEGNQQRVDLIKTILKQLKQE